MQRPSVSIVIPAYNEERYLTACLEAIAAQSAAPLEVIVVDNNSNDGTAAAARAYPFVRVVSEKRQGIVFARNAGFDAAQGDIIARIDADIIMPVNWVAYIQEFYGNASSGTAQQQQAWTGCGYFYNMRFSALVTWSYELFAFRLNRLFVGHYTLWGSNMAITRAQWRAVRGLVHARADIHEDLDLAIHLHQSGVRIVYDRSIRTNARLKRILTEHHKLWAYLGWWPRTLRLHHLHGGAAAWMVSFVVFYCGSYVMCAADWCARRLGAPVLPE